MRAEIKNRWVSRGRMQEELGAVVRIERLKWEEERNSFMRVVSERLCRYNLEELAEVEEVWEVFRMR